MNVLRLKAAVRERDGNRCTKCGIPAEQHIANTGRNLEVHRRKPGSEYSLEGCTTLCRACHGPMPRSSRLLQGIVRLPCDLWVKVRFLAGLEGISVRCYLERILRPIVTETYRNALLAELAKLPPDSD